MPTPLSRTARPLTTATPTTVPRTVRAAAGLWITAVVAGGAETALVVSASGTGPGELVGNLVPRVLVYAAAVFVALQLHRGRAWARPVLAVCLGVFGTLSLVIEPARWLAEGHSAADWLAAADTTQLLGAACRLLHLAAVLAALTLMFRPASNTYFHTQRTQRTRRLQRPRRQALPAEPRSNV